MNRLTKFVRRCLKHFPGLIWHIENAYEYLIDVPGYLGYLKSIHIDLTICKLFYRKTDRYSVDFCRGGFGHMLGDIEVSTRYALRDRRKLIIDSTFSSIKDDINNYFVLPDYMGYKLNEQLDYPISVFPHALADDIFSIGGLAREEYAQHGIKYTEQYAVYIADPKYTIHFLRRVKLQETLRTHIVTIINGLGIYSAINIRHAAGYNTDYVAFIESIKHKFPNEEKIVLCTDSHEVEEYCCKVFGDRLCVPAPKPCEKDYFYNYDSKHAQRYEANFAALTDLFVLASAKELFIAKVHMYNDDTKTPIGYSGFSLFASRLHKRKRLVKRLLTKQVG